MKESEVIKAKVESFINDQKMFTSINIANAIKKDGIWIRNTVVAEWLRDNFQEVNEDLGDNYIVNLIFVKNNTLKANLYFPFFSDPDNFNDRDADALTPDDFFKLHNYHYNDAKASPVNKQINPPVTSVTSVTPVTQPTAPVAPVNLKVRTITEKANDRLKIPAAFIKALGLKPGDNVAASDKVKIPDLPSGIIVQKDFRVSIPRKLLSLGKGPVRICIKDSCLEIEKV